MVAKTVHLATHRADGLREHVRAQRQHVLNHRHSYGLALSCSGTYIDALIDVPQRFADAHRRGEADDVNAVTVLLRVAHHVHEH